jgi:hypothetical protein
MTVEAGMPAREQPISTTGIGHARSESAKEAWRKKREKKIEEIHSRSRSVMEGKDGLRAYLKDQSRVNGKMIPVDIVVELGVMPLNSMEDLEDNIATWANLILSCAELENVNFIFEDKFAESKRSESAERSTRLVMVVEILKDRIREEAIVMSDIRSGITGKVEEKVRTIRSGAGNIVPVEIPIVTERWLRWVRSNGLKLEANQYPVAMKSGNEEKGRSALRNFEAALVLGLMKAGLVIAKRKDEETGDDAEKELPKIKKRIMSKINGLYSSVFGKDMGISEETVDNMLYTGGEDGGSGVRLNLAIDLALPPILRDISEKIRYFHEKVNDLLKFA